MERPIQTARFTIDRAAYLRTMYGYNLARPLAFLAGIALLLAAIFVLANERSMAIGAVIGLVIALPVSLFLRYLMARRNVYAPASRQIFEDPRVMTFSEEGIATRTEGGVESTVPWSHVVKIESRGGFTLLFLAKIVHLIVPDSAFEGSDFAAFQGLVGRKVASK